MTVAALLVALAGAARAAPRGCANGLEPRLNADLFSPVECSSQTLPTAALEIGPAAAGKADLKEAEGRWEGSAISGFGRYEMVAELTRRWNGRIEASLKLKELQFRDRASQTLKLTPAKESGRYAAELSADALPGKTLAGTAELGIAASSGTAAAQRQLDVLFANGARYRVRFARDGKDALRVGVWWAVPGAPARSLEVPLRRTTKESP